MEIFKRHSMQTTKKEKTGRRKHKETIILIGIEFSRKQTLKRMSPFSLYVQLSVKFTVLEISVNDTGIKFPLEIFLFTVVK